MFDIESVEIIEADLNDPAHANATLALLSAFAEHPGGGSSAFPEGVLDRLVQAIIEMPGARVFLAQTSGQSIGIALCLMGFSSYRASRTLNIHDLYVQPEHHGHGIGGKLIERVAHEARTGGYCKVTLEVLESNKVARGVYEKMGFKNPGGTTFRLSLSVDAED
jgi:ribosomal protein S18 acetylase RimI-like enzyme